MMASAMAEMRKSFHDHLADLRHDVVQLFAVVTEAVGRGTDAFLDADLAAVDRLIADDHDIDDLNTRIDEKAYVLLATQQPMATDLRTLVAILRITHELERVGDNMVNVAKGTRRLYPVQLDPKVRGLIARLGEQAQQQLRAAADAFVDLDASKAAAVSDMDDVMDLLIKDLYRSIFAGGAADETELQRAVQVALIGRYYERIGDHAANAASRVTFMVTGKRPKSDHGLGATAHGNGEAAPYAAGGPSAIR
jgi:phosphate transport system protein